MQELSSKNVQSENASLTASSPSWRPILLCFALGCVLSIVADEWMMYCYTVPQQLQLGNGDRLEQAKTARNADPPLLFSSTTRRKLFQQSESASDTASASSDAGENNDWRCRSPEHVGKCAFFYQSFIMNKDVLNTLKMTGKLLEDVWRAYYSASQVRRIYPHSPILLATNYPLELISKAFNASVVPTPFTEILYAHPKKFDYFLKADAMRFVDVEKYPRVLFLDSDTMISDATLGELVQRAVPAQDEDLIHNSRQGWPTLLKTEVRKHILETAAAAASSSTSEPSLLQRRQLLFDVLDELRYHDMALAPETGAFRDMSPAVYGKILGDNFFPYGPPKKILFSVAPYEQQFNTGVLVFQNSLKVQSFMHRWSQVHRRKARCRADVIAWDQCSFPLALRETDVKVGTLSQIYNFREALSVSCSALINGPDSHHLSSKSNWKKDNISDSVLHHCIVNHNQIKNYMLREGILGTLFDTPESGEERVMCMKMGQVEVPCMEKARANAND